MEKETLIKKWLNNELTVTEQKEFCKEEDYDFNLKIIETAQNFKAANFSEVANFNTFHTKYKATKVTIKKLDWFKPLFRVAGVLLLILTTYYTFFNTKLTEVNTLANKTLISLPDQSEVTLNKESSIKYNAQNWSLNRTLNLNGEAFFKVAKGKKFDVITSKGIVTVVGTQFNVKQRNNDFQVTCYEGIVKVVSGNISKQLLAGDAFIIKNGTFLKGTTTNSLPKWLHNSSVFKAKKLKEIMQAIENNYNVHITVEKNVNLDQLFTGGFRHDNLENTLKAITQPLNLKYQIKSTNQVIISEK